MKQVLIKKGGAYIENTPAPLCGDNEILVKVIYSLISSGTEMTTISESGKSILQKAKEQPQNLKLILEMVKKQGFKKTYNLVRGVLESGIQTGYSASGKVIEVGKNIKNFAIGDRVACAGAGKANHAEIICIPKNLAVKIPDQVSFQEASSVTLGSIALQGIRQANPKLGDTVIVSGLGLLGILTAQMLKANGCRVVGIDFDNNRLRLAKKLGVDYVFSPNNAIGNVQNITSGFGSDSVIITAATSSDEPINQAMLMVRKKGIVVIVGAVGIRINRSPFYDKEVDLKISCSYGPGRYDEQYEERGIDYPYAYVRWTENRNMQNYLEMINKKQIDFITMIDKEYIIDEAEKAYNDLKKSSHKPLAVLLKYPNQKYSKSLQTIQASSVNIIPIKKNIIRVAVIGVGGFATGVHLPNLEKIKKLYKIQAIIDKNGSIAKQIAEKYGAKYAGTNYKEIIQKNDIDMVLICTRHNTHAQISIDALNAGKAVFCEKPMALNEKELNELVKTIQKTKQLYTVGFNRRFSQYAQEAKKYTDQRINPLFIHYRMNAGYISQDHWVHNEEGGGRIIGEACHIFDLFNFLTNAKVRSVSANSLSPKTINYSSRDNKVITITYDDGSIAILEYFAIGNKDLSKEHMEIHFDEKTIIIDDYKSIKGYGVNINSITSPISEKGHFEELIEFYKSLRGESIKWPIDLEDLIQATKISFEVEKK